VTASLGRTPVSRTANRRMGGDGSFSDSTVAPPPAGGPYLNLCFVDLDATTEEVTEASFADRALNWLPPSATVHACPPWQDLYHEDCVVARGVVDVDCTLEPCEVLPSRFVAIRLKSLDTNPDLVPCWAWGEGALTETMLNVVSLHTLFWETRMTGYAVPFSVGSVGRILHFSPVCLSAMTLTALLFCH